MKNHGNKDQAVSFKYGMELESTYREIANELGTSFQYIQEVEALALKKFEKKFRAMFPDTWPILQEEIQSGKFGREVVPFM